jgi:hypothetical protein
MNEKSFCRFPGKSAHSQRSCVLIMIHTAFSVSMLLLSSAVAIS